MLTCQEDQTIRFSDEELIARATSPERIFFTQDEDFLEIATRWPAVRKRFCGLIYCHQLTAGIGQIINDLTLVVEVMDAEELSYGVTFLPLE